MNLNPFSVYISKYNECKFEIYINLNETVSLCKNMKHFISLHIYVHNNKTTYSFTSFYNNKVNHIEVH